ncbi:MAG: hypothetical protein ACK5WH_13715 [Hyphomonadaceae bacterium]|jgi:hypothetical protein
MAPPKLDRATAEQAIAYVEMALKMGNRPQNVFGVGRSAVEVAAEKAMEDGFTASRRALHMRIALAEKYFGLKPDWSLYTPSRYVQPVPRQVLFPASVPNPRAYDPSGERERVLMIGDLHQDPRHPHRIEVLSWAARFGSDRKVGRVVQVGDWGTFDGASFHDKNDTLKARLKPTIKQDLDNQKESLIAFHGNKPDDWNPKLDITLGNHENRLHRFENANPETAGMFSNELETNFAQFGWQTRPYGEVMFIQGVGISHHPTNGAGRAFGGKTGPQRAANELTCSFISGHTHAFQHYTSGKIGLVSGVDVMEVGCALPWGEIEDYAVNSITNYWWGLVIVDLMGGRIVSAEKVDMMAIRDMYSDDGADVARLPRLRA